MSPMAKQTAKSVSDSNRVITQMAMWKRIAIFNEKRSVYKMIYSRSLPISIV